MKIPVAWFRTDSSWDGAFPRYILDGAADCHHFLVKSREAMSKFPAFLNDVHLGVFVIPGQHSLFDYEALNEAAGDFDRIVFIINGDEEALFDASKLEHPHKKVWWFTPPFNPKQQVDRVAPYGWPVGGSMLEQINTSRPVLNKDLVWFFAGQVTHIRRQQCQIAAWQLPNDDGVFYSTKGFTHGLERAKYYEFMLRSMFVLCPSGPHTPDTFRFAEALEAGCVPIVDGLTPDPKYPRGYWSYVLDEPTHLFPVIDDWAALPDMFDSLVKGFDVMQPMCAGWWAAKKKKFIERMKEDLSD